MFKLFVFLTLCLALACAAPGLLHSSSPILSTSYHSLPAVRVISSPVWTHSHSIVRPLSYGHGYGWI
ncbi:uncharacterized protein LOC117588969 [Drosophila guanche]|uniref:uncharacterized protein LOC117588969 n=1 Tax=Drosophila guanche TaxID=7266 RepID=UPI00147139FD|nr:uncharacterized protein LOC117588969 [Drosophila guanche]